MCAFPLLHSLEDPVIVRWAMVPMLIPVQVPVGGTRNEEERERKERRKILAVSVVM